ncbi:unnamed protein product [Owenia fusiformis]|uniref:Sulphur transport domain-containing protein n=1 Tax=Owenia fusiformis TaxID=6347 RepID=A0A8J1TCI0_OWEFU|nr:unnamed protein product [Owenia fusiformis]
MKMTSTQPEKYPRIQGKGPNVVTPVMYYTSHTEMEAERRSSNTKVGSDMELCKDYDEQENTPSCKPDGGPVIVLMKLSICFLGGIVFGWALEKTRVFEPRSIRGQFVFERFIMLKMFLAAVAAGQLCMAALSVLPFTKQKFNLSIDAYTGCFKETKGLLTSSVGPFLLGAGMALAGACPGMVLAQVGTWTVNSIYTFIGALLGALFYGLVAPYVVKLTKPKTPFQAATVHDKFNIPYFSVAIPMAILLSIVVFILEWFRPWNGNLELDIPNNSTNIMTARAWPPFVGGILVGLLQIVIVLTVCDTVGGSSSYVTIVSQWVITPKLQEMFPYLANSRCGLGNWWQVLYVFGAIFGGGLSALSSNTHSTTPGVHVSMAIVGGFLMIFGARIGAGCTSGHGLSGMGLLIWMSFLAVPFMFAGGIVTTFIMRATNSFDKQLYDWSGNVV